MDESQVPRLKNVTRQVVKAASKPGGPLEKGEFTMGIARAEVCRKMGFEAGELDGKPWKGIVKEAVTRALEEVAEESTDTSPRKPAAEAGKPREKKGRRRDPSVGSEQSDLDETSKRPVKGRTAGSNGKKTSLRNERSASEADLKDDQGPARSNKAKGDHKPARGARKDRPAGSVASGASEEEEEEEKVSSKRSKTRGETKGGKKVRHRSPESERDATSPTDDQEEKSESEMSSLYDAEPAPRRRKSSSKRNASDLDDESPAPAKRKEKRTKKDPYEGMSPEEAKVAELKRIVVACGVRKQWSKEFADLDSPRDQRRRLESILVDLGMKGNPTMGKAKSLKEKRELAAELNDVREFEAARGVSAGRSSRSKAKAPASRTRSEGSESEGEESRGEEPKSKSALDAVMDFLGDESDSA